VLHTVDLHVDVHKDTSNPGWAIAHVQVNKGAKDPAAKKLLKKGNTGAHKTTHKNVASIHYSQTNYNNDAFQQAIEKAKQADGGMITIQTEEASGTGYGNSYVSNAESSITSAQGASGWEWDADNRMQKYWDGAIWVIWDEAEKKGSTGMESSRSGKLEILNLCFYVPRCRQIQFTQ
jgi:hypothetical protein